MKVSHNPFSLKEQHIAVTFDSPGDFAKYLASADTHAIDSDFRNQPHFYSNENIDTVRRKMVDGDKDAAQRAERLMQRIAAATPATVKRKRVSSPSGRVSIGAYLSADPYPCRRTVKAPSETAPLAIVVSLNSMADVRAEDLEARGVAIAALVKVVSRSRPVNLYLSRFSVSEPALPSCMLVRFPTAPIDSYRLAYLLSSQGFCRGAGFVFHVNAGRLAKAGAKLGNGTFIRYAGGNGYSQTRNCQYARDLEKFLGNEVLYIPGSTPQNPDFKAMVADPVKWVNETCENLTKAKGEAMPR